MHERRASLKTTESTVNVESTCRSPSEASSPWSPKRTRVGKVLRGRPGKVRSPEVQGSGLGVWQRCDRTPNRERQCIGCWLCESPTRRSHSERQCKVVQIRVLVGDAWVRTYSFQADFKAITYQSPCDAVHALLPEEWSARVSTTVLPM